jgi:hypothetical protein
MTQVRSTPDEAGKKAKDPWWARGGLGAGLLVVATLIVLGVIFAILPTVAGWAIKLDSVVLLIAGFVTVTLILYTGTIIMTVLGMRTKTEALGMPPGSIRALIAMVLILIFAIIGVVVLQQSTTADVYTSTGITQAQIDAIRAGGGTVLQQDLVPVESAAPGASPAEPRYTAKIRQSMTPEGHDFALQLLTTVSTLVVAVAGFYFGSKNLGVSADIARGARAPERPAPSEIVPAVPDRSRDEDPGDAPAPPGSPPEPEPAAPGNGEPVAPPPAPAVGGTAGEPPAAPTPAQPPAGADPTALPVETVESLDDDKPE